MHHRHLPRFVEAFEADHLFAEVGPTFVDAFAQAIDCARSRDRVFPMRISDRTVKWRDEPNRRL